MDFGYDFREIEEIQYAVAQNLTVCTVEDEGMILDRLQKLNSLKVRRWIAA